MTTPDRGHALDASEIVVRFEGLVALDGVSCTVEPGEVVGLIGPNGAGKTTLVNVLTGFQTPTSGTVVVDGQDVTRLSPQRRARKGLGRTFQGSRLYADLTVSENVEVSGVAAGLRRRAARERAAETLALVGMADDAARQASDLSTGQERRLQVARAIAMHPRYLFLDEPAAGLNEVESDRLLEVIAGLPELLGCAVVLIEHDMRVIMGACARIIVLDKGRLLASGTPDEIRSDQAVIDAYLGS